MKKYVLYILFILLAGASFSTFISCKTGYGCPAEEQYKKNQGKPLSKKKGKSRLFKEKS